MWKQFYIPISLSDYPKEITAILFFPKCNFHCGYCHNDWLLTSDFNLLKYQDEILTELAKQKNRIDGVTITGGEPLLTKDIIPFIKQIKKLGYKIKLDSNGSLPKMLKEILKEDIIDYVAIDLKSSFQFYNNFSTDPLIATKWEESLKLLNNSKVDFEIRTTLIKEILDKDDYIKQLQILKIKKLYLQEFNNKNVKDEKYKNFHSYNKDEMQKFKELILNNTFVEECYIRA